MSLFFNRSSVRQLCIRVSSRQPCSHRADPAKHQKSFLDSPRTLSTSIMRRGDTNGRPRRTRSTSSRSTSGKETRRSLFLLRRLSTTRYRTRRSRCLGGGRLGSLRRSSWCSWRSSSAEELGEALEGRWWRRRSRGMLSFQPLLFGSKLTLLCL
jgi:hypothetical protein